MSDTHKAYLVSYAEPGTGKWIHTMRNLFRSLEDAKASSLMTYHNVVISEYLIDYPEPSDVEFRFNVLYKHGSDIMERNQDGTYSPSETEK